MKLLRSAILIFIGAFLSNCKHGNAVLNNSTGTSKKIVKKDHTVAAEKDTSISDTTETRELKYGFTIIAGHTGKFKSQDFMEVWHNKLKIFKDTSEQYVFDEKPYPLLNQLKPNVFELFIPFFNGPNKDLVTFLRIENNKVLKKEQLPTFDIKSETVNGILIYHSVWDNGEVWEENGKMYTTYNPEIYYKFTPDGIKLDTALSILKGKQKYGRFDGFTYKGTIGYPCDDKGNITDTSEKNVLRKSGDN